MATTEVGFATKAEFVVLGEPAMKVTALVKSTDPTVAVRVFTSAAVDDTVAVNTPTLLVVPDRGVKTLLDPVLDKDTAWPLMGLPWASCTVTLRWDVLAPSAVTVVGLATHVDVVLLGVPATKVTEVVTLNAPMVAVIVLVSAVVELSVVVNWPLLLVEPALDAKLFPVPLAARLTDCPDTGLL